MSAAVARVALVNDHELVLAGLRTMLGPYRDRVELIEHVVGIDKAADLEVDVILVDTFGRGREHETAVTELIETAKGKVVVFTWVDDAEMTDRLLTRGIAGYLSKCLTAEQLVNSITAVNDGNVVVSTSAVFTLRPQREEGDWPGRSAGLSQREAEVLLGITRGLTNEEIGASLFLSINSIKTYVRSAYRKIGVQRRAQAVLWGLEHGFDLRSDLDVTPFRTRPTKHSSDPG